MNNHQREIYIRRTCRDHGCDDETGQRHRDQFMKHGWDPHPPTEFMKWWNPTGTDPVSGAHVGGQPDALRIWARKDQGGWIRRPFGSTAEVAWNTTHERDRFTAWQETGEPDSKPFVSISATLERQKEFWRGLKAKLGQIGRPMPKATAADLQREQLRSGLPARKIEPLDEQDDDAIPF